METIDKYLNLMIDEYTKEEFARNKFSISSTATFYSTYDFWGHGKSVAVVRTIFQLFLRNKSLKNTFKRIQIVQALNSLLITKQKEGYIF